MDACHARAFACHFLGEFYSPKTDEQRERLDRTAKQQRTHVRSTCFNPRVHLGRARSKFLLSLRMASVNPRIHEWSDAFKSGYALALYEFQSTRLR